MDDITHKKRLADKKYKDSHKAERSSYMKEYYEKNKEKRKAYNRKRYTENRDKIIAYQLKKQDSGYWRAYNKKCREEVLREYGGCCQCCGENIFEFLCIHHGGGNGKGHRKAMGQQGGDSIIRWLKRNKFPKNVGITILCHNCHSAIHFYGVCPHATN